MIRAPLASLAFAVALAACGSTNVVAGFVIEVKSTSITQVDSFVLRTQDGTEMHFRVGALELDSGAFPAIHLREHMALNQPVAVAFREEGGERIAYLLKDAPWLQP